MKNHKRLIPFPIIQVACEGNAIAIHYKCCFVYGSR